MRDIVSWYDDVHIGFYNIQHEPRGTQYEKADIETSQALHPESHQ